MDMLHVVNHIFLIQVNKRLGYSIFCFLCIFCRSVVCLFGLFRLAIRLSILPRFMNSDYLRERPFNLKGWGYAFFYEKNILIPNVAEKNILILVEEKKII